MTADSLPGVSMRRVAASVGVEPMSLYHYVPSKAALLVLMTDRSATRALSEARHDGTWDEQLLGLLIDVYRAGVHNPALFQGLADHLLRAEDLLVARTAAGRPLTDLLNHMLSLLEQAPLPRADLAYAFRGLIGVVVGFLVVPLNAPTAQATHFNSYRNGCSAEPPPAPHVTDLAQSVRYSLKVFLRGMTYRTQ